MSSFSDVSGLLEKSFFPAGVGRSRRKTENYEHFNIAFSAEITYASFINQAILLILSINSEQYLICYYVLIAGATCLGAVGI